MKNYCNNCLIKRIGIELEEQTLVGESKYKETESTNIEERLWPDETDTKYTNAESYSR